MTAKIKEIPLQHLGIYGLIGTSLVPIATYAIRTEDDRQTVINEILGELATKDIVIMANTLIKTESFDGFRIL